MDDVFNSYINKALICKLEGELNSSFNDNEINAPRKSFFTQKYIQLFNQQDLSNIKSKKEFYLEFIHFLNVELKKDGIFNRGEEHVFEYFQNRAKHWELIDKTVSIDINDRFIYIVKKFIIDSINGLITEEIFFRKIKNIHKLEIRKSTVIEDANMCVDYFIKLKDIECGFQVKPISFFRGIKSKKAYTLKSLKKIEIAVLKYKIPIIFVYINNKEIFFVVRDKKTEKCNIITESEFFKILEINLTKDILYNLSIESIDKMRKNINFSTF